jgi:hypothetical protein
VELHVYLKTCFRELAWHNSYYCIGIVMVSELTSSAVDRGLQPWSIQLVFVASLLRLRSKSKDWLAQNQNKMYQSDMSYCRLMLQWVKLAQSQSNSEECWSGKNRTSSSSSHQTVKCSYDIAEKLLIWH